MRNACGSFNVKKGRGKERSFSHNPKNLHELRKMPKKKKAPTYSSPKPSLLEEKRKEKKARLSRI